MSKWALHLLFLGAGSGILSGAYAVVGMTLKSSASSHATTGCRSPCVVPAPNPVSAERSGIAVHGVPSMEGTWRRPAVRDRAPVVRPSFAELSATNAVHVEVDRAIIPSADMFQMQRPAYGYVGGITRTASPMPPALVNTLLSHDAVGNRAISLGGGGAGSVYAGPVRSAPRLPVQTPVPEPASAVTSLLGLYLLNRVCSGKESSGRRRALQ